MIAKLIVPISHHLLMNGLDVSSAIMSMTSNEMLLDCSDSWTGRNGVGYECMSCSWGMSFEVSIIPERA